MAEKKITIDLAKRFNLAMRQLLERSEEAVERLEEGGATEFVCTNYRQAVMSFAFVAKYVRDFAGSATTAAIENDIAAILDSVTPPKLQQVADDLEAYKTKRATKKKTKGDDS